MINNMELREITNDQALDYFNFLKDLKTLLEFTDNISMNALCKKHDVARNAIGILKDNNIIKTNNKVANACRYYWASENEVNRDMAIELINRCRVYHNKKQNDLNVKKGKVKNPTALRPTQKHKDIKEIQEKIDKKRKELNNPTSNKTVKFSMFFGLIKYEKTIV